MASNTLLEVRKKHKGVNMEKTYDRIWNDSVRDSMEIERHKLEHRKVIALERIADELSRIVRRL